MDFSTLFIRRPVMTTLFMAAIVLFGVISFRLLPVAALPSVDFPTITVTATLPGANPDTIAGSVATPLERQFSTIAGLSSMTSTSSLGSTNITLQFDLSRDIDSAAQDVQTAISAAARSLPADMPTPPSYKKVNPADQPIFYLAIGSESLPLYKVDDYAETLVAQRLSMVNGVAQVNVFGSQKFAVHAQLNPDLLAARGLGMDDVRNAITGGNVNLPTGNLYGEHKSFAIEAHGQLLDASQYRDLVVAYRNGYPVRLGELGKVVNSVENDKTASWFNGKRAIVLAIMRQPNTNTVGIVDEIKRILPELRQQIPGAVTMNVLYDRSDTIRDSVRDVEITLVITIILVIGVIYLFLQNISATIIPSLALPTSIIGTFAFMYLFGFSLNNLTLMALTLCVGFVVDDAVVVLENIVRRMELGEQAYEAAINGTREIWFTVISMTLSLVAVFTPILFMGGIIGRVFNEFAITIGVAILLSGVVSLTLTPMLCSRWLKPGHHGTSTRKNIALRAFDKGWDWSVHGYRTTLRMVMQHQPITLIGLVVLIGLTAVAFSVVPKGFMPEDDTGMLQMSTEGQQDISFEAMSKHQQVLAGIVQSNPNVQSVMSATGGNSGTSNQGRMFVVLKPQSERNVRAKEIIVQLRPPLAKVPGVKSYIQIPPTIRIGGRQSKALYQVTLQGTSTKELLASTDTLLAKMRKIAELTDLNTDVLNNAPQVSVVINRELAATLNVTQQQIEDALANAYGTRQISTIYAPTDQYHVIVEVAPEFQRDIDSLSKLYIHSPTGASVPLRSVAKLMPTVAPLTVNHQGQFPATTISFNLSPGASLGPALEKIEDASRSSLQNGVTMSFQGQAQAFQSSFSNMNMLLILAMVVIYIILGMLYESFIHPLTILSGLPAAGLGALVTLMLFHVDLDIYGFLGLVMLIGIVKKNAIMMVDFAIEKRRESNATAEQAIYEACLVRFRPIMMTTMAALMGAVPIAMGLGAGGESRQPLGLAVFGGLVVSQLLTLYITPVVYVFLDNLGERFKKPRGKSRINSEREGIEPSVP